MSTCSFVPLTPLTTALITIPASLHSFASHWFLLNICPYILMYQQEDWRNIVSWAASMPPPYLLFPTMNISQTSCISSSLQTSSIMYHILASNLLVLHQQSSLRVCRGSCGCSVGPNPFSVSIFYLLCAACLMIFVELKNKILLQGDLWSLENVGNSRPCKTVHAAWTVLYGIWCYHPRHKSTELFVNMFKNKIWKGWP